MINIFLMNMNNINKWIIIPLIMLLGKSTTNCTNSMEPFFDNANKNKNCIKQPMGQKNNHITINNNLKKQDDNNNIFDKYFMDDFYQDEIKYYITQIPQIDKSYETFLDALSIMFDRLRNILAETIDNDKINEKYKSILTNPNIVSIKYVEDISKLFDKINVSKIDNSLEYASNDFSTLQNYIISNKINTVSLRQLFYYVLNRSRKLFAKTMIVLYNSISNSQAENITNNLNKDENIINDLNNDKDIINNLNKDENIANNSNKDENVINNLNKDKNVTDNLNKGENVVNNLLNNVNNDKNVANNLDIVKSSYNILYDVIKSLRTSCTTAFNVEELNSNSKYLMDHLIDKCSFALNTTRSYFSNFDKNVLQDLHKLYLDAMNKILILKEQIENEDEDIDTEILEWIATDDKGLKCLCTGSLKFVVENFISFIPIIY